MQEQSRPPLKEEKEKESLPQATLPPAFPVLLLSSWPPDIKNRETVKKHFHIKISNKLKIQEMSQLYNEILSPFPRSSGSPWTTTALPIMEFGPESGIYKCLFKVKRYIYANNRNVLSPKRRR